MALPTAEQITNLYLYGTTTKPTDITSDGILAPRNNGFIQVNGDETELGVRHVLSYGIRCQARFKLSY